MANHNSSERDLHLNAAFKCLQSGSVNEFIKVILVFKNTTLQECIKSGPPLGLNGVELHLYRAQLCGQIPEGKTKLYEIVCHK